MLLDLKLNAYDDVNQDLLNALRDGSYHNVKISTTKKYIELDKKDARMISALKNVKIVLKKSELRVELPYFGRMYSPSYDTANNSYRFTSKDFTVSQQTGKKGSSVYTTLKRAISRLWKMAQKSGNARPITEHNPLKRGSVFAFPYH